VNIKEDKDLKCAFTNIMLQTSFAWKWAGLLFKMQKFSPSAWG